MNVRLGDIEHPAHSTHRILEDLDAHAKAKVLLETAYDSIVDDPQQLAANALRTVQELNETSIYFESRNIKQLLGSIVPKQPHDTPIFDKYYELAGDPQQAGARLLWFGEKALKAFERDMCADKITTELGGKKLRGDASLAVIVRTFEQEALRQVTRIDSDTRIHVYGGEDGLRPHSTIIEPFYVNPEKTVFSMKYARLRVREAVADIEAMTQIKLFRTTYLLVIRKLLEPSMQVDMRTSIEESHVALQDGKTYSPANAEELYAAALQATELPSAYIPLTMRSLALVQRPLTA